MLIDGGNDPYVIVWCKAGSFSLLHFISTTPTSGLYLDTAGQVKEWSGFTWETLNYINGRYLHRSGYCYLMPNKTIDFVCLKGIYINHEEAIEINIRLESIEKRAPYLIYHHLKAIMEMNVKG